MNYLLLTLGHNSSAIFVDNSGAQQRIVGYEQERLSRIKADSQFPIDAINEIEKVVGISTMQGCTIFISHWFNSMANAISNKYFTLENSRKLLSYNPSDTMLVDDLFTHHDAHAYSALAFVKHYKFEPAFSKMKNFGPLNILVVDGFGTDCEVLSLYETDESYTAISKLKKRVYGYQYSLGLFYQYATSYVGMKENQDEYKFLGYEAHIDEEFKDTDIDALDFLVSKASEYFLNAFEKDTSNLITRATSDNRVIDLDSLKSAREVFNEMFDDVMAAINFTSKTSFGARVAIAYFIQQTCEKVLTTFIKNNNIKNIALAGGVFYNVKLNNTILNSVQGSFSVMPLAGDQGAAIGMYEHYKSSADKAFSFETLSWGVRNLYNFEKLASSNEKIHYRTISRDFGKDVSAEIHLNSVAKEIAKLISEGTLVDVVCGNMEFGPRALGHTSTLFLPSAHAAALNNIMNKRNEVMPCAPICNAEQAVELFDIDELTRVIGSDRFMICTHEYIPQYSGAYGGVMHKKTLADKKFTGRPQVVRGGSFMDMILTEVQKLTDFKCLVNTSFNVHGNPIVFGTKDIIDNFVFQCEHAEPGTHVELFVIELV